MTVRDTDTLEVVLDDATLGSPVTIGVLQCERRGASEAISFAYDRDYLERRQALALAPQLPLVASHAWPTQGQALLGVFRGMAPDRWGRALMERCEALEARESGRRVRRQSE